MDMNALLKQAQEMQQQMADAQAAAKEGTGSPAYSLPNQPPASRADSAS